MLSAYVEDSDLSSYEDYEPNSGGQKQKQHHQH